MELLADYSEMEEDILLEIFKKNVAILPLERFNEILNHIEMYRNVDVSFITKMRNSRVDLKRKKTNRRSYIKNKVETIEKEIYCLKSERDQLARECDKYKREIHYYKYQMGLLSSDFHQNNDQFFQNYGNYEEFVNTNENQRIGNNLYSMNMNFNLASDPEFNQQTQYKNISMDITIDLTCSLNSLGLGTNNL